MPVAELELIRELLPDVPPNLITTRVAPDQPPAVKRKIEAGYVYPTACVIAKRLRPFCRQIEIAGSLRRRGNLFCAK